MDVAFITDSSNFDGEGLATDFSSYIASLTDAEALSVIATSSDSNNAALVSVEGSSTLNSGTLTAAFTSGSLNDIGATISGDTIILSDDALMFASNSELQEYEGATISGSSITAVLDGLDAQEIEDTDGDQDFNDELQALLTAAENSA